MVINSPAILLVFQFEDVRWDYTLGADREMVGKKNQHQGTSSRTPVPRPRRQHHDQMRRLALEPEGAEQLVVSTWIRCWSLKGWGTPQNVTNSLCDPLAFPKMNLK